MPEYIPDHTITKNYALGMEAIRKNLLEDAIGILQYEPEDSPCYAMALGNCALAHFRIGHFQQAEKLSNIAIALIKVRGCPYLPSYVQFSRNLGDILAHQGRYIEAIHIFNQTCHLADELTHKDVPHEEIKAIEIEKAHIMNSWGATLINIGGWSGAKDCLKLARSTYLKYGYLNNAGGAEVLTNLSIALRNMNDKIGAELSLKEALDIVETTKDEDQIYRIKLSLIQLRSKIIPKDDYYSTIESAADYSIKEGRYSIAHLRLCIGATLIFELNDIDNVTIGLDMLERAKSLECHMDSRNPNIAKLRLAYANLLEINKTDHKDISEVLIEGAYLWYESISAPILNDDFDIAADSLHDHFRLLAHYLIEEGRIDEALLAFEAGRALSYSKEVDENFLSKTINENPFSIDGKSINKTILHKTQNTLDSSDVIIVLSIVPPETVVFLVYKDHVDHLSFGLPKDSGKVERLFEDIKKVPIRLSNNLGEKSIPDFLHDIARQISSQIGNKNIVGLIPYSVLHLVPWRALFYYCGIKWDKLTFSISFSFLLRAGEEVNCNYVKNSICALGYGTADSINLENEARDFAEEFEKRGEFIPNATKHDVLLALLHDKILLISCHGKAIESDGETQLELELADGICILEDCVHGKISSPLVILSACESGVYSMAWSDYPSGAAPFLIKSGVRYCIGTRFPIKATFAANFFKILARYLSMSGIINVSFTNSLDQTLNEGADLWADIACLEIIGRT
jgi:tetratricopeptide (TPR) repeat protein